MFLCPLHSSVGTVTSLCGGQSVVCFLAEVLLFVCRVSCSMSTAVRYPVVKRPGRESDYATLPGAEVENEWKASAPPTTCHATHSDDPIFSCRQSSILPRRACLLQTKQYSTGFWWSCLASSNRQLASSMSSHRISAYFKTTLKTATHCALEFRFAAAAVCGSVLHRDQQKNRDLYNLHYFNIHLRNGN